MKKLMKKERGITLIALVVTIIVLLILAGVSIQMLTGQTGILKNAEEASETTKDVTEDEQVKLAVANALINGTGTLSTDNLTKAFKNEFGIEKVPDDTFIGEGPWTFKGERGEYTINPNGTVEKPVPPIAINDIKGKKETEKANIKVEDNSSPKQTFWIPAGFKLAGDTTDTVDKGIVIEDEDENQFVWVPVPNAKSETIVTTTNTGEIELGGYNSKTIPMAEKDEKGNYRGVLYDETSYNLTGETKTVKYRQYSATGYREPDVLKGYDGTDSDPIKITKETLQDDYDTMVGSVSTYGGFYIARYEMSLSSDGNAQYKKGETSTSGSIIENQWYGFYEKQKEFATKYSEVNSAIKSSMIWGSQYDAMMNWMARCGKNVTATKGADRNKSRDTGTVETDKINNIYDLYGNSFEWTLEAYDTFYRTDRGGCSGFDYSPSNRIYNHGSAIYTSYYGGSRASLYL